MKEIILGLMRIADMTEAEAEEFIYEAYKLGIRKFDLADIYGAGKSEKLFGYFIKKHPELRKDIIVQTKCGIDTANRTYNFTYDYIISHVKNSLKAMNLDYLDYLLLHRPDILINYDDLKRAFVYLKENNLVKHFGVSNMSSLQIEAIEKKTGCKMEIDQVQFSLAHHYLVTEGINFNLPYSNMTMGLIDYATVNDIKLEAWSILLDKDWNNFIDNPNYEALNMELANLAKKYNTTKSVIAVAWVLRHDNIIPVVGTTKISRVKDYLKALEINLTHEEYYNLLKVNGVILP